MTVTNQWTTNHEDAWRWPAITLRAERTHTADSNTNGTGCKFLTRDPIRPDPEVFDPVTWPGRFDRRNVSARSSKLCVANLQQHGFQTTCWSVVVSCVHIHYKIRLNSRIFAQTCNRAYVHCIAEQLCTDPLPDQTSKIVDLWPSDPKTWFHVWTEDFSDYRTRDLMLLCWQRSAVGARPRER